MRLQKPAICEVLGDHPWSPLVQVYEQVDSTNTMLKAMAAEGAPEGTVILADSQSAGRGRMGRQFLSPEGQGIYLSALLRPKCQPQELMHLTCAVAAVLCGAVEKVTGLRPGIKWTNDLVAGGHKVAGILTELSLSSSGVDYAVIGVGINCNQDPEEVPEELRKIAGSLAMAGGKKVDREALAAECIRAISTLQNSLIPNRLALMERYRKDCVTLGKEVLVQKGEQQRRGKAVDIDDWGALLVDFGNGPETVLAGEVSVRGMYGYL